MLHTAEDGRFFFFFCYFFSGHDLLAPIGVLGPEDSKVHKILTEMQRKLLNLVALVLYEVNSSKLAEKKP